MRIAFDIDGVLDEAPTFFSALSRVWDDDIYIITYRDDRQSAIDLLKKLGIRYTELVLVTSFAEKAEIIKKYGIRFFVDDQPEVLMHINVDENKDKNCSVLLFRNEGNYDAQDKKWILSTKTAKLLF